MPEVAAPILRIDGITKRFGALVACDDISLDVRPSEIHALIGPNGAGKSTLIKQIAGDGQPDAGTVHVEGRDVTDLPAARKAQAGLGRCFQVSALALELSALENVMLADIGRTQTMFRFFQSVRWDAPLRQSAMAHLDRVGLSTQADQPAASLAHGQRRLLELAIALAMQPRIFLLDEPMAGLGTTGSQQITAFLDGLRHQAPILLVEHDMDAVFALADRISVLVYGRIIATGTRDEIRTNPKVQDAYLGQVPA